MSKCVECTKKALDNRLACKEHICKYCWERPIWDQKQPSNTREKVAQAFISGVYYSNRCQKCQKL